MNVLKCRINRSSGKLIDFAFEVLPEWSVKFMVRSALFFLELIYSDILNNALAFNFLKFSHYELEDDDIYVDLISFEEVSNALLCDPRQ